MKVNTKRGLFVSEGLRKNRHCRLCGNFLRLIAVLIAFTLIGGVAATALAQGGLYGGPPKQSRQDSELPAGLRGIGIDQKVGEQMPLNLVFRDETGREVRLNEYFGSRPVILALVYYECPMLCNQVLNGLTNSLRALSFNAGNEFDVVAVSFDPRETSTLAREKKESYVARYNRPGTADGWHFLTGEQESISRLADAVGFRYRWDDETKQFAHASGIMLLTPGGKLARYFFGIDYAPSNLRLGIVEASEGKVGSPVDQIVLYCFHYDPATGKYGAVVMNILKVFSLFFLIVMGIFFMSVHWWNTRRAAKSLVGDSMYAREDGIK
jgi:protein SCO1